MKRGKKKKKPSDARKEERAALHKHFPTFLRVFTLFFPIILTCLLCWSGHRSPPCRRRSVSAERCSPVGRTCAAADKRRSGNGWPLRSQTGCWRVCSLTLTCRCRFHLWKVWKGGEEELHRCDPIIQTPLKAPRSFLTLTYTEDVKTKSLGDRFTDQLIGEAVEPNMSTQRQATLLFILEDPKKTLAGRSQREQRTHKHTHMRKTLVSSR